MASASWSADGECPRVNHPNLMARVARRRSATERESLQIQLGHAPEHEGGHETGSTARHRPAHVTVAAVQEEIAVPTRPQDGGTVRRHWPQAGAVLPLLVVGRLREEIAGQAQDVVEVTRRPAPVVPGELGGGRQTQAVAEP